jgi:hypothetical protein
MKSLVHAVAVMVALCAPVASFSQSSGQPGLQDTLATQGQASGRLNANQPSNGGQDSGNRVTWHATYSNDTTVSSYSPPIHNAR